IPGTTAREVIDHIGRGNFPPPRQHKKDVPPALEAICLRAMARRPEDRYPSALELASDLEHWLADEPVAVYREPWTQRLTRWMRRHRTGVAAAGVALVLGVAGLFSGLYLWESAEQRRREQAREYLAHREQQAQEYLANLRASAQASEKLGLGELQAARF